MQLVHEPNSVVKGKHKPMHQHHHHPSPSFISSSLAFFGLSCFRTVGALRSDQSWQSAPNHEEFFLLLGGRLGALVVTVLSFFFLEENYVPT